MYGFYHIYHRIILGAIMLIVIMMKLAKSRQRYSGGCRHVVIKVVRVIVITDEYLPTYYYL